MASVSALLAGVPPFPDLERDTFVSSTSATTPRCPCTDLNALVRWDIAQDVLAVRPLLDTQNVTASISLGPYEPEPVTDEETVRAVIRTTILRSVAKCLGPFQLNSAFRTPTGNQHVVGHPDIVYRSGQSTKAKVVIEVKTDWAFPQRNPILADWPAARSQSTSKLTRAIQQLYGYMTFNHLRYGVLTTYNQTWFFRRVDVPVGGGLEVTDAVPHTNAEALVTAYVTVALLAESSWFYASPTTSPAPVQRFPSARAPTPISDPYILRSVDTAAIRVEKGIDRSRVGVVVRGTCFGLPVIMKIVDASKEQWAVDELDSEVAAYRDLQALSGTFLPQVIAYVEIWDMLRVMVLEDCGNNLRTYEENGGSLTLLNARCNECLAAVNRLEYEHRDVKKENFVIDATGTVRLIDLGQAAKVV
ncbi:hypothetical protein HDU86_003213 [Geranomyces michiganensis]|nr:hypothetical protein HDU86_003213 [Geranomyces michiganensis]